MLNKDTFEPDPIVLTYKVDSTSKSTWGMVLLIVRAMLRRPSLSGTPTVTFCSVHIHNVVAKKRDASTELIQRLHGYMKQHNVDFIGGDFNMSAFSTVGDVLSDTAFSAPGNSFLWGLGALEESIRERTGFLIKPKRPYDWRVDTHGCYKFDNAALGFGTPKRPILHDTLWVTVRKLLRMGLGPCESVERRSRGHRACRKAEVEDADGSSSSRQERVRLFCTF